MKQRRQFDLVIIGADAPGLAAAACAARAHADIALRVAVVRTGEEAPAGPATPGVPDFVWRRLDLHQSNLKAKPVEAMVSIFDETHTLATYQNPRRTARALEAAGADDNRLWTDYADARTRAWAEAEALLRGAAKGKSALLSELGGANGARLARRLTQSCADILDDHFDNEELKTHLASAALMPLGLAGDEPGSGLALASAGDPAAWRVTTGPKGPSLMKALEDACAAASVTIFDGAVRDIEILDEKNRAVILEGGETLKTPLVMTGSAANRTASRLGAAPSLSPLARRDGASAEVRVKLAKTATPPGEEEDAIFFAAGSREALKVARDAALEGHLPDEPPIYFRFVKDEIVVTAPYCPAVLYTEDERRDWSEQDRQALGRRIVERLGAVLNGAVKNVRRVDVKIAARESAAAAVGAGPVRLLAPPASHDEIGAAARLAMELVRGE